MYTCNMACPGKRTAQVLEIDTEYLDRKYPIRGFPVHNLEIRVGGGVRKGAGRGPSGTRTTGYIKAKVILTKARTGRWLRGLLGEWN